jgi:hypothetical protein
LKTKTLNLDKMKIEEQNLNEPQKPQLNIAVVVCSACGELIPDHQKFPAMIQMDKDDIECMSCEMLARDSADLDNCFGSF